MFHRAINPPGKPRAQEHDAREMLPRKKAERDGGLKPSHFLRRQIQLLRGANAMQFIQDEHFLVGLEIGDHRIAPAQPQFLRI